jgi:hypothetical protein
MKRAIVLNAQDSKLLEDVLSYITIEDDREKNDFEARALDIGVAPDKLFDEHYELIPSNVPNDLRNHIFYKATILANELVSAIQGG